MLKVNLPDSSVNYNYDEIVKTDRVFADDEYAAPEPIFVKGDSYIMTKGNLSMIQGQAKSRKTFFLLLMNYLILNGGCNIKKICIFDTEQTKYHSNKFVRRLREMSDKYQLVDFYNLRRYGKDVRFEFIQEHIQKEDYDIVFIDNIRDCVKDFNSIEQSDACVTALTNIAENTGVHICVSLHLNPGSDKARGHLGTELIQKAETVFDVSTEDDVTTAEGKLTRNKPFEPFAFRIDDGLPRLTEVIIEQDTHVPF